MFATDTFLVVAGVKLSYSMCRKLLEGTRLKMNGLEWIVYMFGRYLGLAPMLYIWIAIFIYIVPHVVEGPFTVILQQDIGIPMDSCKANWWSNILYINNFYPFTDSDKCLDWTDYIGVEAQLFFLSPIVIYLIFRYRKIGSMLAWLLVFLPMGFRFYIALNLGLPVTPFGQKFIPTSGNNNLTDFDDAGLADYINFYPYTRCDSIIIGILVGCMLALRKTNANSGGFRMNRAIALLVGLILAAGVSTCIFGLTNQWYPDSMSADWRAAWHTVSRTLWALYVAWIIICDEGKAAGPVGAILGLKIWKPLQRLVYSSFLIYPGIAQFYLANQRNPIYFDDLNILCIFLLILAATVLVAAGFTLIFEVPFRRFEQSFRLAFLGKRYLTRDFDETDTGIAKSGDDTEDLIDSAEQQPNA